MPPTVTTDTVQHIPVPLALPLVNVTQRRRQVGELNLHANVGLIGSRPTTSTTRPNVCRPTSVITTDSRTTATSSGRVTLLVGLGLGPVQPQTPTKPSHSSNIPKPKTISAGVTPY